MAVDKQGKSAATAYAYRNAVETDHLRGIWSDRPLSDLATETGMNAVVARHEKITKGETGRGWGAYPRTIPVDNGSEFISRDLDLWTYANDVVPDLTRPGKPTDNGFIEAFNSTLRAECLNAHWFRRARNVGCLA
ncbi:Integrase core domain-containing protein [Jannaschia seohaensis]|uniref:Integrase core domain-containing protein n=1 Tax=Jannaschia seohaensis TaxID=475081 RepID=A0A2Y9B4N7_9RHOB|nr:integrase-like protein [Jannaschia seohaensis]SSA51476.1 Integrase core domain-containing protein [Jannaschia seohaensis]